MRTAAALAVLLAIATGLFWKLTLSDRYTWLENPDQAFQARPWFEYEAREWHAGRIPLWAPYELAGQTLIGQVQPGVANPLNWPLFAMPLQDGHIRLKVLHWWWVLLHFAAAAFAYLLCRDLGCGLVPSIAGGAIFGYLGYIGLASTPYFLTSSLWFPLVLLFFLRVLRGERPIGSAALCGAALGASFLGGHHNVPVYSAVVLGAAWVWLLARSWRIRRVWIAAAVCLVAGGLVSAVQALPAIEYGKQSLRWSGAPEPQRWGDRLPYSVHTEYGLKMRSIAGFVVPGLAVHANSFIGIVALALALAAIRYRWRSPEVPLLVFLAVFATLLALGADTPLHKLAYHYIPLVEKARYPAMVVVLAHAAIAALAAIGLSLGRETLRKTALPLALAGIGGLILYRVIDKAGQMPTEHPAWQIAVVAVALAVVMRWGKAAPAAVLALLVFEAATLPRPILRPRDIPDSFAATIAAQTDLADFLKSRPGWFRVVFDEKVVPYNFGDVYGVEQLNGYFASMPLRLFETLGSDETPRLYGVRYRVATEPSNPNQVEVFQSRSGVKIFEDPRIGEPVSVRHADSCGARETVKVVTRWPGGSSYEADLGCPGLVVIGDPYFRGWRAEVDGRRTPIQEFGGGVRAVAASPGHHRIEFRYRPSSVYLGAALSVMGLMLAAYLRVKAV
jgi:hypothetical protein